MTPTQKAVPKATCFRYLNSALDKQLYLTRLIVTDTLLEHFPAITLAAATRIATSWLKAHTQETR